MNRMVGETYWQRVIFFYIPLFMFLVMLLFPFYWMIQASIKPDRELYNIALSPFYPRSVTFDHFAYLFENTQFLVWMVNTFIIALASTVLSVTCGVLAGYSLSRLRYPGSTMLGVSIFVTYLVPPTLLFIPLSRLVNEAGLMDTRWSLVLTYPTILIPFSTWLLMGYFRTIPKELEECARIDGATRWQAFIKIILPLGDARHTLGRPVFLHSFLERVSLCAGFHQLAREQDSHGGRGQRVDDCRHLLLGIVDGGRPAGLDSDRHHLFVLRGILRRRIDRRRSERLTWKPALGYNQTEEKDKR